MAKGKNVLTAGDVAKICKVASRTVVSWFDKGLLKGYRIPGGKDRRIPLIELERFMRTHKIPIPVEFAQLLKVDTDAKAKKKKRAL